MKYIIGIIVVAVILFIFTYLFSLVWGIDLFAAEDVSRTLKTVGLITALSIILIIIGGFFFKNPHKGYERGSGVAEKKID